MKHMKETLLTSNEAVEENVTQTTIALTNLHVSDINALILVLVHVARMLYVMLKITYHSAHALPGTQVIHSSCVEKSP